jgi:hypothetical protein
MPFRDKEFFLKKRLDSRFWASYHLITFPMKLGFGEAMGRVEGKSPKGLAGEQLRNAGDRP